MQKRSVNLWEDILFVLAIVSLTMLPYMNDFLILGHDLDFHLARIEGISQGIRYGQFPVKINPIQANGYGNASSTMYPQLFLYIPAMLRIAGMSLLNAYKLLIFEINLLTAVCSFMAFRAVWKSRSAGAIGCALYMMGLYRLDNLYIRAAIGESLALAFLPLIFWGMYEIFWGDWKKWPIATLGFSLVLESHILSTEMYVIVTAAVFLAALFVMDSRKQRLMAVCGAAGLTLLLNMGFIVPFLDYLREGFAAIGESNVYLPDRTVYLSQMFSNFMHIEGHGNLPVGTTQGEMPLTIGLLPVLGVFFWVYMRKTSEQTVRQEKESARIAHIGSATLFLAAVLTISILWIVPWDVLDAITILKKMASTVQFLWRFLGVIYFFVCCTIVSACQLWIRQREEQKQKVTLFLVALSIVAGWPAVESTIQYSAYSGKEEVANTNLTDYNYLYQGDSLEETEARGNIVSFSGSGKIRCLNLKKEGIRITMELLAEEDDTSGDVAIPLYYYPGYRAFLQGEAEQELPVVRGENGIVRIEIPPMQRGEKKFLEINFFLAPVWKLGYMVSGLSVAGVFIAGLYRIRKRRKQAGNEGK